MTDLNPLLTIPSATIVSLSDEQSAVYAQKMRALTAPALTEMITSPKTGAFLRGLANTHNIPAEKTMYLALGVLRIALGEKTLAQLPSLLSTELQIANDKAQAMAKEIEKELFAPIALQLNQFHNQTSPGKSIQNLGGARNVLDLKTQPRPPVPPPIPR